jgi:CheY-like chemotaxis protein
MNMPLSDTIIVVADDQTDVARTLCQPLRKAGASLRYIPDGRTALAEIAAYPADLILVDMKMPPEEWGGLWLLSELREGGWMIPAVALSGEGSKRQVIEALRLGAKSWVDKDQAGEELLDQCATQLADSFDQALDLASARLPTPIARPFARYTRMVDPDKRVIEGLHVLESVLRFTALIGMSTTPPQALAGITAEKMRAPSMRTWLDLCIALARAPQAGNEFTRLVSFLMPNRAHQQLVHDFVSHRNDISHGRATPDHAQGQRLDALLRRFAHRAQSAWRSDIALPVNTTYDGSIYSVEVLKLSGTGTPSPSVVKTYDPAIIAGQPILISNAAKPQPLTPWLITQRADSSGDVHCLLFDSVQRTTGNPVPDTPMKYSQGNDRNEPGPISIPPGGTWKALAPWLASP